MVDNESALQAPGPGAPTSCEDCDRPSAADGPDQAAMAFERASTELQSTLEAIGNSLSDDQRKSITTAAARLIGASHVLGQLRGHANCQAAYESAEATLARRRDADRAASQALNGAVHPRCVSCILRHPSPQQMAEMPATPLRASLQTYNATPGTHLDRMKATVDALIQFAGRERDREHQQAVALFALQWKAERDDMERMLVLMGIDPDACRTPSGGFDVEAIEQLLSSRSRERMT